MAYFPNETDSLRMFAMNILCSSQQSAAVADSEQDDDRLKINDTKLTSINSSYAR